MVKIRNQLRKLHVYLKSSDRPQHQPNNGKGELLLNWPKTGYAESAAVHFTNFLTDRETTARNIQVLPVLSALRGDHTESRHDGHLSHW